jgi:NAD(P)-dependent dehydrogenase (short-subunit alcohol dehydrogenase family)
MKSYIYSCLDPKIRPGTRKRSRAGRGHPCADCRLVATSTACIDLPLPTMPRGGSINGVLYSLASQLRPDARPVAISSEPAAAELFVVYITGAASGIGLACAQRFADDGATVVGTDLTEDPPENFPGDWVGPMDVRDEEAQLSVVESIIEHYGQIDAVVTAAGVAASGAVHTTEVADWKLITDINLTGTFITCKCVVPHMIEKMQGSITTIASVQGLEASQGRSSAYGASKAGVILLTKNMASDYGLHGIRVNAICPGYIATPMTSVLREGKLGAPGAIGDRIRQQHKLGRYGEPSEIASVAAFLAGPDASFMTGVALPVDGGFTAGHSFGL